MYWIVCVPYDKDRTVSCNTLKRCLTVDSKLCEFYDMPLPNLKVGTLNSLMSLSDDLNKTDIACEQFVTKALRQLGEVSDVRPEDFVAQIMLKNEIGQVQELPVERYIQNFKWDITQFSVSKSLRDITQMITEKIAKFEDELKARSSEYSSLRTVLTQRKRKDEGSLTVRPLTGIVQQKHVVSSEYLTTLFVVVPKSQYSEWQAEYANFDQYIVPESSELVYEDNDSGLWNVVLFRKIVDNFKHACRERRYTVRDFEFDPRARELSESERQDLEKNFSDLKRDLLRLSKTWFSDGFIAWMHLRAIRAFVEAILRHGLPPQFVTAVLKVSKNEKRIYKTIIDITPGVEDQFDSLSEFVAPSNNIYNQDLAFVLLPLHIDNAYLKI